MKREGSKNKTTQRGKKLILNFLHSKQKFHPRVLQKLIELSSHYSTFAFFFSVCFVAVQCSVSTLLLISNFLFEIEIYWGINKVKEKKVEWVSEIWICWSEWKWGKRMFELRYWNPKKKALKSDVLFVRCFVNEEEWKKSFVSFDFMLLWSFLIYPYFHIFAFYLGFYMLEAGYNSTNINITWWKPFFLFVTSTCFLILTRK